MRLLTPGTPARSSTAASADPDAFADAELSDERLLELYGRPDPRPDGAWLRVNFVESLDGAASVDGVSGGLQPEGDSRVFGLLRRLADTVLVASGTVLGEGYGALRVDEGSVSWRREHGMPDHPVFAIVSGRLDLDPASPIFVDAPVRPIVVTTAASPSERRAALNRVADILIAGEDRLETAAVRRGLAERGLAQILCEGGPSFFGELIAGDAVDELCLTLSPLLTGGDAGRIAHGPSGPPRALRLAHAVQEGDALFLSYRRAAS